MLGIYWTIVQGSYQQRCKYTISGFSFYKDRDVLKTVSNAYDGAFLEKAKKNSHYPRKIKYPQNIRKKETAIISISVAF